MTHTRPGRILVVEDQGIVATDIQRCLEDGGFEVTGIATSMEDAIQEATQSRPDLVLMDIRIQGEADGIDAGDHLHRHFGLPIVYLTAHDDRDTMSRAKRTEPMAFLIKPFKPAELTSTVEIALQRSWAEEAVHERERSFLSALGAIGDAVLTADSQGCVRFMNRATEELTGWSQELALGRPVSNVVQVVNEAGDSEERFHNLLSVNGASNSALNNEYRVLARNGIYHWLGIKAMTIAGVNDSSIRVVVMQDVTRRKENEQELRRQAHLLEQAQEPIFTWELDGAITYWNQAAQALYGFSPSEALGRAVAEVLRTVRPATEEALEEALKRDGRWSGELTRKTKDGREIIVECLLVVVHDGTGRRTVLETDRDITERKNADLEIRRLNQELSVRVSELTTLNQELESFNYSISHDLRAPLRHIDAYTKILLEQSGMEPAGEVRTLVDRVRRSSERMGRMVDELLELSRTSRVELVRQATGLNSMVEDLIVELKQEAPGREIEWRVGSLPVVDCDPTLTRQIFANLLANAVKYSRDRNPAVIEVDHTLSDGQTVLLVRDNGVGFNMKYADKMFGVFHRLHRREDFDGTGIGLATVQRIIHKHGGRVWAEGEVEKGATFYFTLGPPEQPQLDQPTLEPTAVLVGEK